MNETEAVLNFFSQPENLPLALDVGALVERIQNDMNNRFWQRLTEALSGSHTEWEAQLTQDQRVGNRTVGLTLSRRNAAYPFVLKPFMEQQDSSAGQRIYYGLIWSSAQETRQQSAPGVAALKKHLQEAGFGSNEQFLAWRWTLLYPRDRDFLLHFSANPEAAVAEPVKMLNELLAICGDAITTINRDLAQPGVIVTIPLSQLRRKNPD